MVHHQLECHMASEPTCGTSFRDESDQKCYEFEILGIHWRLKGSCWS